MYNNKNRKIAFATLGCKVNTYETEALMELFVEKGYTVVDFAEVSDVYVINTCTVTNLGDKKSRQMIRRARKQNPDACVVAMGCYAQVSPGEVSHIEGVNIVAGTKDRKNIIDLVENYQPCDTVRTDVQDVTNETDFEPLSIKKLKGRTRAFLKIQDGCNRFCSYCIIPYARGRARSRAPEQILEEVAVLAQNGFKEIVLTGIHIASYGTDLPDTNQAINLATILQDVSKIEGIERLRVSSLEPNIITDSFVQEIQSLPNLCDHFHLSLQSGCDKTLQNMRRRYDTSQYEQAIQRLRSHLPEVSITTDVIVGFPGETEEDFLESYAFCEKIGFTNIHVFPYSNKKGTVASTMPDQVPAAIKSARAEKLSALGAASSRQFLERYIGKTVAVLIEKEVSDGVYEGHTTNYICVHARSDRPIQNSVLMIRISEILNNEVLMGDSVF